VPGTTADTIVVVSASSRSGVARRRSPTFIIAASAELSGLHVLHVDKGFDTIAAPTGQPTTRLA